MTRIRSSNCCGATGSGNARAAVPGRETWPAPGPAAVGQASHAPTLAPPVVNGLDGQHDREDQRVVLAVGDVDGELLPQRELPDHRGDRCSALVQRVVAAEAAARG